MNGAETQAFSFNAELKKTPRKSGVYIMKDAFGRVIYVGKAKCLKSRLSSYFRGARDAKTQALVSNIASFEYIITDGELEALILECNLIKKHKPRYNIKLKDNKAYPYIKVSVNATFPCVTATRRVLKDKAKYFGPYTPRAARETLDFILKIWRVRRCGKTLDGKKKYSPCLNYHIGKCHAPCNGQITAGDYAKIINEITLFLNGKFDAAITSLENEMFEKARLERFEEAAVLREAIASVKIIKEKQRAEAPSGGDFDAAAISAADGFAVFFVLFARGGKITGGAKFYAENVLGRSEADVMAEFLERFYFENAQIPKEIAISADIGAENRALLELYLKTKAARGVTIVCPQTGKRAEICELAKKNANSELSRQNTAAKRASERADAALRQIADALGLKEPPARIEAFDVSNTSGVLNVGSMVVFENGEPKKNEYRKYKIKSVVGANDPACMGEVVLRRFSRGGAAPALILVDGGAAQASAARSALSALGVNIPVCGMVKDDNHKTRGLFFNGTEITLPKTSEGFLLTERVQNEAHRFAVTLHRRLSEKKLTFSELDGIKGIGPKRRAALIAKFGSAKGVAAASPDELAQTETMSKRAAEAVYAHYRAERE